MRFEMQFKMDFSSPDSLDDQIRFQSVFFFFVTHNGLAAQQTLWPVIEGIPHVY